MRDAAEFLFPADDEPGLDLPEGATDLARCPMHRVTAPDGPPLWLATGHDEIREVLSNPTFSRAAAIDPDDPDLNLDTSLLGMDPPEHTRLRSVVARSFGARRVGTLRANTQQIAEGLLDDLARATPPVDLIPAFCLPLPVTVICQLLGVPADDRPDFCGWSEQLLTSSPAAEHERVAAQSKLTSYMASLIAAKRADPADDLLSDLVTAHDEHERLTEDELVDLGVGILVGGHETTATQLANFTYLLLRDPDLAARLRAEPGHVPAAVEEMLRLVPLGSGIGGSTPRVALRDVDLGGVTVRAGEAVLCATGVANRSPALFPEPDRVVLDRPANPHLTFGHGVHHCLGSQLARMELQVGLTALLQRFPTLAFATGEADLEWRTGSLVRGLRRLPVRW